MICPTCFSQFDHGQMKIGKLFEEDYHTLLEELTSYGQGLSEKPRLVALNKIDKPNADRDRVKQQLAEVGLVPDDWDGDTIIVPISAKQRTGLDDLLEAIVLIADNMDILANPKGRTIGTVIESSNGVLNRRRTSTTTTACRPEKPPSAPAETLPASSASWSTAAPTDRT